jgi:hypothetical protein
MPEEKPESPERPEFIISIMWLYHHYGQKDEVTSAESKCCLFVSSRRRRHRIGLPKHASPTPPAVSASPVRRGLATLATPRAQVIYRRL